MENGTGEQMTMKYNGLVVMGGVFIGFTLMTDNEPFFCFLQRLSSMSYKSREEDPSLTEDEVGFLQEIQ